MAPLNVEAAEKYLVAIPLVSLSNEPVRIPTACNKIERQPSWDSQATEGSPCSAKDLAAVTSAHLNVHRAERFLASLQLEDPFSSSLDFGGQVQANGDPTRHPSDLQESDKGYSDNRISEAYNQNGRKNSRGGCFTLSARQMPPPNLDFPGLDQSQVHNSNKKDSMRTGFLARALRFLGWTPAFGGWVERKETWSRVEGTSYASYLAPAVRNDYDPDFLDDQNLHPEECQQEVSVIPFVRPRGPKEELNEQFRLSHPGIHPSITLSKLRNLQKDLREITTVIPELDMSTVALAWVYFEKLVLADYVRKSNRKLLAGACLVLAFKFNQHGDRALLSQLAVCIRKLDRKDQLNLEDLHDAELKVFFWLEFSLFVGHDAYSSHLHRLLKGLGSSAAEYYGTGLESCALLDEPAHLGNSAHLPAPTTPQGSRKSWSLLAPSDG